MHDWQTLKLPPDASLREAIQVIDRGGLQIALLVDADGRLLGTITDGDVRRAILRGVTLDASARTVMNASPTVSRPGEDREALIATMQARQLHRIPLVDAAGKLTGLASLDELIRPERRDNIVVLMAGGIGSRLRPLTDETPKPMLKVGDRPILETILLNFISCGFHRFYICVNYKAEVMMQHFGDGSGWGVDIRYIREPERMGTAGALGLLPEKPALPLIVMNGDLLTKTNFASLLDFHQHHRAAATMCVRKYEHQVPYGVVKLADHRLVSVEEKPVQRFFVNAGIYVLSPEVAAQIKPGFLDMPDLLEKLVQEGREISVFPIQEYWLDIGQLADFDKAKGDFDSQFK
jgi:dTDP-glucose pyrophosphorylase